MTPTQIRTLLDRLSEGADRLAGALEEQEHTDASANELGGMAERARELGQKIRDLGERIRARSDTYSELADGADQAADDLATAADQLDEFQASIG